MHAEALQQAKHPAGADAGAVLALREPARCGLHAQGARLVVAVEGERDRYAGALPGQEAGCRERPARTRATWPRQVCSSHCQGCCSVT
ncbi:hypothetical protein [Actinomadura sp. CNU-125]|uniref:hypothetical protein n=1 Tax=Actinomadura sp. CNU-125 TaxID=1904961 RepID=UPI0016527EF0|nr:hypothetical protein [Actinomadura sp. CNU-125]